MEALQAEIQKNISSESSIALSMRAISKSFSGVTVLKNINIDLYKGEVHALMGENGAGKSTLMKIMAGIHRPDKGEIIYRGQSITWKNAMEAREKGISVIHQELNLSPNITIGENVLMGTKFPKNKFGMVDWKKVHEQSHYLLQSIGCELDPRAYVSTLSVAQQQMVEIARALSIEAEVLVMDEPTASLTHKEIDKLFIIMNELKQKGVAIVYISHRMDEIFKISDRCTILRDGEWITSVPIGETNPEHLVKTMVGRELNDLFQKPPSHTKWIENKIPVLELKQLSDNKNVKDISLEVHSGEIVGISGLVGAGRTELVRTIFGLSDISSGEILINGQSVRISSPEDAMRNGIAHVPESRKEQGLFLNMSVKENIMMAEMFKHRRGTLLKWSQIDSEADNYIKELGIKTASKEQKIVSLSGGNQQKALLARWLSIHPKVLLLDEPTRGVDIGAKTEIHRVIYKLAKNGLAVLMISSELPEILALSDRILVMHEGKLRANLQREDATQEKIMFYATGEIQ